jgi:hypothetical protein
MRHIVAALAVGFASVVQLAACSHKVSTLDEEKTLGSLTMEERRQYCEDRERYMDTRVDQGDLQKIRCANAAGGLLAGGPDTARERASCKQVYRVCMNTPTAEKQSMCDGFATDAERCAATVGEANECARAQADELAGLASRADGACDRGPRSSMKGRDEGMATRMQTCARVQLLCPKLFEEPIVLGGR